MTNNDIERRVDALEQAVSVLITTARVLIPRSDLASPEHDPLAILCRSVEKRLMHVEELIR